MKHRSNTNHGRLSLAIAIALLVSVCGLNSVSAEPTRDEVLAALAPYDGESVDEVDRSTLTGKVMAGYQGWFTAQGDGAEMGWYHYQKRGQFRPGRCSIDLWPDVRELAAS